MVTICSICARGGSQGVPGKNIRMLMGKPLIVHTIEQALATPLIERVFVSTDDPRIADVARVAGAEVPFLRPPELATSTAPKIPVIEHLVKHVGKMGINIDRIVDLDPTSPLRTIADIERAVVLLDQQTDCVITGYRADKNPYFNMVEQQPDGHIGLVKCLGKQVTSRQEAPVVWSMNGSVYVWHRHTLQLGLWNGRVRLYEMPRERSIDIDSEIDFQLVEILMEKKWNKVAAAHLE